MNEAVETIEYRGMTIEVYFDPDPMNPRTEWDNMCEFHCSHKRYVLEDEHYENRQECAEVANEAEARGGIVTSLYLYDHSGLTLSTAPFSCPWDSRQVGFVILRRDKLLTEFGGKRLTKALRERAEKIITAEVSVYDAYLRGAVYGYVIKQTGDSCWGFYDDTEYMIEDVKSHIDCYIEQERKAHCKRLKGWIKNKVGLEYRSAMPRG